MITYIVPNFMYKIAKNFTPSYIKIFKIKHGVKIEIHSSNYYSRFLVLLVGHPY